MFHVIIQIAAMWLASSLVVGIVVGKLLKRSNDEMEQANRAVQPAAVQQARPVSTHAKAG